MIGFLFPYDTPEGAEPTLTIAEIRLNGVAKPRTIRTEEATANFYDELIWDKAELDLVLTCRIDGLSQFEATHGSVLATVVVHCLPTNTRQPIRLKRSELDPGRWSGTLELDRHNFRNRVELATILTATVNRIENRPVAFAPRWTIHMDEPESLRIGKTLPIKWENFTLPTAVTPGSLAPKSTHAVRFAGKLPELVLNSGFTGLESLLKDRRDRKGAEQGLHDLLRTGIARSVWMVLLADAMAAIRRPEEDGESPDWPETPWQAEVLKLILPEIDPAKSPNELLTLALDALQHQGNAGEFYSRAETVIGDIINSNETLRRFVSTYRAEEQS